MRKDLQFYMDENVPLAVEKGLRLRGVNVLTTQETGMRQASDKEQLLFAHRHGRVLITQDDDFLRLHAAGMEHAGIVYAHQQTSIGRIIQGILLIYQVLDTNDMRNHVEFL